MEFSAIIVWQNTTAVDAGIKLFNVYPFMPDSIWVQYFKEKEKKKKSFGIEWFDFINFIYLTFLSSKSILSVKFYTYHL